jgi:hypothetical protein
MKKLLTLLFLIGTIGVVQSQTFEQTIFKSGQVEIRREITMSDTTYVGSHYYQNARYQHIVDLGSLYVRGTKEEVINSFTLYEEKLSQFIDYAERDVIVRDVIKTGYETMSFRVVKLSYGIMIEIKDEDDKYTWLTTSEAKRLSSLLKKAVESIK